MKKRIVIITDCADIAYNELRGVILDNIKNEEIMIEPVVSGVPYPGGWSNVSKGWATVSTWGRNRQ